METTSSLPRKTWRRWCTRASVLVLAVLAAASAAQADRVRTQVGIGLVGKVVGLDAEGLLFEVAGGRRTIPLADIASIEVDGVPALARAEEAYAKTQAGGPEASAAFAEAERLYRSLARPSAPPWLTTLTYMRLYKVYADSGRMAEALDTYLKMAKEAPRLVTGLRFPKPQADRTADNQVLLKKVEAAIKEAGDKPYAQELKQLRLALRLLEGKPEEVLPLLGPMLASADPKTRQWATLKQLELLLATGQVDEAEKRLDEAAGALEASDPSAAVYLRGRILSDRGRHVSAALEFLRVPILYAQEDRLRTAEALWRAGCAMDAAGLPAAEVAKVYNEAVRDYPGTPGAERAKEELAKGTAPKG
ncbi:MAG TPA: hypothetical protein VMY35_11660 [Phycisphaerae bacterium]|nr:hypothetical protein [Phycisphaerae bacterium]